MPKAGTNRLREAIDNLQAAQRIYQSRVHTLTLLADPMRGTDYDSNTRAGISDPTPTQAFTLQRWHDLQNELDTHLVEARNHAKVVYQLLNRIPSDLDTARLCEQHRCTGGSPSTDTWTRPECVNNAVTRDGLCDACRQRRDHYRRNQPIEGAA